MAVGGRARRLETMAVAVLLCLAASGCQANWAMFGFDAGNSRASTDDAINLVNVRSLANDWVGSNGQTGADAPAVVGGLAYVGVEREVAAFDTRPTSGCSGDPTPCEPTWTGTAPGWVSATPAVIAGRVYVGTADVLSEMPGSLAAFDAAGVQGCAGAPKVCDPLWIAPTAAPVVGAPTVVGGRVYVGSTDGTLYAFDASGAGCSGSPVTCDPLWTATTGGQIRSAPAVVGGVVYAGSVDGNLYAFDASGAGCSGSPLVCEPLWRGPVGDTIENSPVVAGSTVYVASYDGIVHAFDATAGSGCSGTPLTCTPRWQAPLGSPVTASLAVAGGRVFAATTTGRLFAVDAAGQAGCTGSPATCSPLWSTGTLGSSATSPSVVGGVVLVTAGGRVDAFDAAGELGCTATTTVTCTPVWQSPTGMTPSTAPIVANGAVYVGASTTLRVFRPQTSTVPVPPVVPLVDAVVGNGEITLRWDPVQRVDLPLSALVLHRFEDGVETSATDLPTSTSQLTLTGLDPETAYSFQVSVRVGTVVGARSPMSDVETPSPEVAPAGYRIDAGNAGRAVGSLPANPGWAWTREFPSGLLSQPVYADGRVFVAVSGDASSTSTARVYALDATSGATLWGPVALDPQFTPAGVAYEDHRVYVGTSNRLRALDEATGAELWSQQTGGGSPRAHRGLVYFGGKVVDGRTGAVLRSANVVGTPAIEGGDLYSVTSDQARRTDALTGATVWDVGVSSGSSSIAVLSGGALYAKRTYDGWVIRDAATGATIGSASSIVPPAFSGNLRFELTVDRLLRAIDVTTGEVRWIQEGDGRMASAPVVAGPYVLVSTRIGNVLAFDAATGAQLWYGLLGATVYDGGGDATVGADHLFVAANGRLVAFG